MQGLQWPHANVFPIADILRSALSLSACRPCLQQLPLHACSCPPAAASAALSRKHYFGSEFTSFMAAVARAASAPDGTFVDNSRMTCLRCCNNFLCLRTFQVEVTLRTRELLAPLASSATCAHEGVRGEWALLLRNMAAAVHCCRPDGFEDQAHYIADLLLPMLHPSRASHCSGEVQWNATLALGTCLHILKPSSKGIGGGSALANEARAALLHLKTGSLPSDSSPISALAHEALQLLEAP